MAFKCAGRGQDPSGIDGTPLEVGGLAVECPACPHPGRNLPTGWENVRATARGGQESLKLQGI